MEFTSIVGSQHILEPIGYNQVRKKRRRGVRYLVRSIEEQFMIHSLASEFRGSCLFIPKPLRLETSPSAYIMDMLINFVVVPSQQYKDIPQLFEDLINFKNFMYVRGYFAAGFTILRHPAIPVFALVDYSQFGSIDCNFVMFPKIPNKFTIFEAESSFGLIGFDIVTQSFKNKHIVATSPKAEPRIDLCPLDLTELELSPMLESIPPTNTISIERTFSASLFSIDDAYWDKIEPLLTHVNT